MRRFAVKTERNVRRDERPGDTIPEQAHVYVPPRPLASLSDHRTMDVKAIRLAAEVDPRQALTELKLEAPPRRRPAKDWVVPVAFAVLAIGFITLWWATPGPLPLDNTVDPASVPLAAPSPPPAAPTVASPGEPAERTSPARDVGESAPAALAPAAPLAVPPRPERTAAPPNATATVDVPPATVKTSAEPSASPRRPKGGRNPWLE